MTTIPTVVQLANSYRELDELQRQQQATQARMIRECVTALRCDPNTYRLRGHETYQQRAEITKENRENKAKALLYLEWLATQLENAAGVDLDTSSVIVNTP